MSNPCSSFTEPSDCPCTQIRLAERLPEDVCLTLPFYSHHAYSLKCSLLCLHSSAERSLIRSPPVVISAGGTSCPKTCLLHTPLVENVYVSVYMSRIDRVSTMSTDDRSYACRICGLKLVSLCVLQSFWLQLVLLQLSLAG